MTDKMMRISGRGEDGKAKPFATDNAGVSFVKNPILKTYLHSSSSESGNGTIVEVNDYNSITFQVIGSFEANVTFQASIYEQQWETISVEDGDSNKLTSVNSGGFYKADVSGYERVRAVVDWESGTNIRIVSIATLASYSPEKHFVIPGQNKVVKKTVSDYQVGKNIVFYGDTNVTERARVSPVNFEYYSKRSIFVKNNLNTAIKIIRYNKHIYLDSPEIIERVETNIDIPVGGLGKLSYIQYPDLNEPFKGLSIDVQASGIPNSGEVEIYWLGGIN